MISTKRRMYVERYNLAVLNAVCESKVMHLNMAPPPLLTPNILTRYHFSLIVQVHTICITLIQKTVGKLFPLL